MLSDLKSCQFIISYKKKTTKNSKTLNIRNTIDEYSSHNGFLLFYGLVPQDKLQKEAKTLCCFMVLHHVLWLYSHFEILNLGKWKTKAEEKFQTTHRHLRLT